MPMTEYNLPVDLRWADLDPNFHLRHSVYYDFGAQVRMAFLSENGLTTEVMQQTQVGPVLFREECIFRREVWYGDSLTINMQLLKLRRDFARFSFRHEIKKADGTLCAILTVDGAWMDTKARKLTIPPAVGQDLLNNMPKAADFEWQEVPEGK